MAFGNKHNTELCNTIAILADIPTKEECDFIVEKLVSGNLSECSLSMKFFKYEALLKTNIAYKKNIIYEIRNIYKPMLKNETNTIWEVAEGEKALIKPAVCVMVGVLYPFYIYKNTRNL